MNKEVKKLWVEALRSKEYPQTIGMLRRDVANTGANAGFCCLGVLTDLACKAGVVMWEDDPRVLGTSEEVEDEVLLIAPDDDILCDRVKNWAGLDLHDPVVDLGRQLEVGLTVDEDTRYNISLINDKGATFEEIAKLIEEQL